MTDDTEQTRDEAAVGALLVLLVVFALGVNVGMLIAYVRWVAWQ